MDTEDLAVHSGGGHTAASGVILGPQPGVPLGKGRAMERNVLWAEVTAQPLAGPSWLNPIHWIIGSLNCWVAQLRFYFRYGVVEKAYLPRGSSVFLTEPFGDTGLPSLY